MSEEMLNPNTSMWLNREEIMNENLPAVEKAEVGTVVEQYQVVCDLCGKAFRDGFTIYVEDRDGQGFDGHASVLASFVFCGPKCLRNYAESYGEP